VKMNEGLKARQNTNNKPLELFILNTIFKHRP
jgi:hypothetical protein